MWRPFRKASKVAASDSGWWQDAAAIARTPTPDRIRDLERRMSASERRDDLDLQREMVAGLQQLHELMSRGAPPVVPTQHRVVGDDSCYFIGPAGGGPDRDAAGKLFVTSRRVLFVSGTVAAWPWHRIAAARRAERDVVLEISGAEPLQVRMNTLGEALVVTYLVNRLAARRTERSAR